MILVMMMMMVIVGSEDDNKEEINIFDDGQDNRIKYEMQDWMMSEKL